MTLNDSKTYETVLKKQICHLSKTHSDKIQTIVDSFQIPSKDTYTNECDIDDLYQFLNQSKVYF